MMEEVLFKSKVQFSNTLFSAIFFLLSLIIVDANAQYCATSVSNGGFGLGIASVKLQAINNSSFVSNASLGAIPISDYTSLDSARLQRGGTYAMTVKVGSDVNQDYQALGAWIDWDQNSVFDVGEELFRMNNILENQTLTLYFVVPLTAVLGTTRMRVAIDGEPNFPAVSCGVRFAGETEDYKVVIETETPMSYVNSDCFHSDTLPVYQGTVDNIILGIRIITSGTSPVSTLTSITFNTIGTTFPDNISSAKLLYTAYNDHIQNSPVIFGTTAINPSGLFSFTGNQVLNNDTNYFWLTYDIKSNANICGSVDASCMEVVIDATQRIPVNNNPLGNRKVFQRNLVPNYSFEKYTNCPTSLTNIDDVDNWFQVTSGSSDFYYNCFTIDGYTTGTPRNIFGYQKAKGGWGYSGLFAKGGTPEYREYVGVKLKDSLVVGKKYCAKFHISFAENSKRAVDGMGMAFSVDSPTSASSQLSIIPKVTNPALNYLLDSISWTPISASFIADSAYNYLIIGNFKSDLQTNDSSIKSIGASPYYYVDDVILLEQPDVVIGGDSLICELDTAKLSVFTSSPIGNFEWTILGTGIIIGNDSVLSASPTVTTTYVLKVGTCSGECAASDTFTVVVIPLPNVNIITSDTSICSGDTLVLNATAEGGILWTPNSVLDDDTTLNTNAFPVITTVYTITVTDTNGCQNSDSVNISIMPKVAALVHSDTNICKGSSVQLYVTGGTGYLWYPAVGLSRSDINNPFASPLDSITYTVVVTDICENIDSVEVDISVSNCSIYLPNAFTPGGNKANNLFIVRGEGIKTIILKVYDRWGQLVFSTNNPNIGWDGYFRNKSVSQGVYVYVVSSQLQDGRTVDMKGTVTVLWD